VHRRSLRGSRHSDQALRFAQTTTSGTTRRHSAWDFLFQWGTRAQLRLSAHMQELVQLLRTITRDEKTAQAQIWRSDSNNCHFMPVGCRSVRITRFALCRRVAPPRLRGGENSGKSVSRHVHPIGRGRAWQSERTTLNATAHSFTSHRTDPESAVQPSRQGNL